MNVRKASSSSLEELRKALDRLAGLFEFGELKAATAPVDFVNEVCDELERWHELKKLWSQACEIAREHCPVEIGESRIDQGIPRLAAKVKKLMAENAELRNRLRGLENDS